MTWLMTWRVASCQGMRLPLCQILDVVWMGMRVEVLLHFRAEHGYLTGYRELRGCVTDLEGMVMGRFEIYGTGGRGRG